MDPGQKSISIGQSTYPISSSLRHSSTHSVNGPWPEEHDDGAEHAHHEQFAQQAAHNTRLEHRV
eukprot:1136723-Pelagomonas_calceolata.AAC.3